MMNTQAILAGTALFDIASTPSRAYEFQKFMSRFYALRDRIAGSSALAAFSTADPLSRNFEEMGYFTTSFIPL